MSNTSTNNQNFRRPNRQPVKYMLHKFDSLWFARNPENAGGANILSNSADAFIIGVTGEGVNAEKSLAKQVFAMYKVEVERPYMKAVREGFLPGSILVIPVDRPNWEKPRWFILVCVKALYDEKPGLDAIATGLRLVNQAIEEKMLPIRSISSSRIGVGESQLDWKNVGPVFAREFAQFSAKVCVYGIKHNDPVFIEENGEIVEYSREQCIEHDKQRAMDAPKHAPTTIIPPAPQPENPVEQRAQKAKKLIDEKKANRARRPRKPLSDESVNEPVGMFQNMPEVGIDVVLP